MIKIAHESPLSIMNYVSVKTDYDYALVHLFETNKKYYDFFVGKLKEGREVYLDNSLFELGKAFDSKEYAKWIEKLQPTYYILPDVFQDGPATVADAVKFLDEYKNLPSKAMAVCQGSTFDELSDSYVELASMKSVDMVAIPFRTPYSEIPAEWYLNDMYRMGDARKQWIKVMLDSGLINFEKPHHLLGCFLPQEFKGYKNMDWIYSLDTSNPVAHAMKGYRYDSWGLSFKDEAKIADNIDLPAKEINLDLVDFNMEEFKSYVKKF